MYEHEAWTVGKREKRKIYAFSSYGVGGYSFGLHSTTIIIVTVTHTNNCGMEKIAKPSTEGGGRREAREL